MIRLLMSFLLVLPTSLFGRPEAQPQAACASVSCSYLPVVVYSPPIGIGELEEIAADDLSLEVKGEVYNITQSPVYDVTIAVRAYDDTNQLISTQIGQTDFFATFPGQSNPFEINTNIFNFHRVETVVTGWLTTSVQTYQPATITMDRVVYSPPYATVSGEVRNDLETPLYDVHYAVWSLQQEWGIIPIHLTDTLLPGQAMTYTQLLYSYYTYQYPISAAAQGIVTPTLTTNQSAP